MPTIKITFKTLRVRNYSIIDYCRYLIEDNCDPNSRLEVYRDRDEPDVVVRNIGEAAQLAVENDKFRKCSPPWVPQYRNNPVGSPVDALK